MFQELLDVSTAFVGSFSSVELLNLVPSDEQISRLVEERGVSAIVYYCTLSLR
jgi:hypothetical protein